MDVRDTQNLYRRLGKFLKTIPVQSSADWQPISNLEEAINIPDTTKTVVKAADESTLARVYVVAKSRHYGHDLSFEKFTNCGWHSQLHFNNGGLAVNLLRLDPGKLSKVKHTLSAYQSIDRRQIQQPSVEQQLKIVGELQQKSKLIN